MDIPTIPPTISNVENNFVKVELVDISSPRLPFHIFVIPSVNNNVNNARLLVTAETKDAGPNDKAKSNIIIANCAVINSLIVTNTKAGLRLIIRCFTSFHVSDLTAKHRNVNPNVKVLNPCVYRIGSS